MNSLSYFWRIGHVELNPTLRSSDIAPAEPAL